MKEKKCQICGELFAPNSPNRKYCFTCTPIGSDKNRADRARVNAIKKLHGAKCKCCGYDISLTALDFHHIDPDKKKFAISTGNMGSKGKNVPYYELLEESLKCILVCRNCHAEIHYENKHFTKEIDYRDVLEHMSFLEEFEINIDAYEVKEVNKQSSIQQHQNRPSALELAKLVVANGFSAVGRKYGVSDSAIKKWCKAYGIPHLKTELKIWYNKNKI